MIADNEFWPINDSKKEVSHLACENSFRGTTYPSSDEVARPPSRVNSPKPNRDNKTDGKVQIVIDPTSKKLSIPPVCR